MSGGGFRAVLFHVGALIRLNQSGVLSKLKRISSVSGGSIASGVLAVNWAKLVPDSQGRFTNLDEQLVQPLRTFCGKSIDVLSVIGGALNPFKSAGEEVIDHYRDDLGLGVKLKDLSDSGPRFVFNATNLATGASFRFSKPYCGDYRIGLIKNHDFDVALAVGCSSAFPPVLSPIDVAVNPDAFEKTTGADLYDRIDFRRKLQLADGGVYDNLGLETVWGRYATVLASDAGKPFELDAAMSMAWPRQLLRVMDIGLTQALALRKRMLISQFESGVANGAYFGIATNIQSYGLSDSLAVSQSKITELSNIRTRLDHFNEREQCELMNWGYAVSDAALRSKLPELNNPAGSLKLPYPQYPLG
jgi:NTE family protein